ncbi:hypothetical protein PO878_03925 [Iamia majanohamensis]|uniref:Uncharacterized protein n=1 Tax=Iamia majanohamensis TaxID=467976 RepID=A0AAE9YHH3_9ACTN|nr:hypothetical protein [Iamia majanohamensis]WCO67871.1 hypothetical protein PO878_03925 [Iamia majanohamensis]
MRTLLPALRRIYGLGPEELADMPYGELTGLVEDLGAVLTDRR